MRSLMAISEAVRRQEEISGSESNSSSGITSVEGMRSRRGWVVESRVICGLVLMGLAGAGEGEEEGEEERE